MMNGNVKDRALDEFGKYAEPFTLSRLAQPLIEAHKMMPHGLTIRPDQGGTQLKRVGSAKRMQQKGAGRAFPHISAWGHLRPLTHERVDNVSRLIFFTRIQNIFAPKASKG